MNQIPASTLITNALLELGVIAANETAAAADATLGLSLLNRIIDSWSTREVFIYTVSIAQYTLVPSQQTYTIGPGGNFDTTRPTRILNANIILTSVTPNVRVPLQLINDDQWASIAVQNVNTTIPTKLYYDGGFNANGQGTLFFWGVPTAANSVELFTPQLLTAPASLSTTIYFPPGYEEALTLTLAERMCGPFNKVRPPSLIQDAMKARAAVIGLNTEAPLLTTDSGLQASTPNRPYFNYRTGDLS